MINMQNIKGAQDTQKQSGLYFMEASEQFATSAFVDNN